MNVDSTFFYVEANIVCIIIFLIFLMRNIRGVDRQVKLVYFDYVLLAHVLYFCNDIIWVLILNDRLPRTLLSVSLANLFNATILLALSCFWFFYIEIAQGEQYLDKTKNRLLVQIPAIVSVIAQLILFLFFPSLMITEELLPSNLYYLLFICAPAIYIVVAAVRSFIRAFRKENFDLRNQYLFTAAYPLMIVLLGIVQTSITSAPVFCFALTILMLYMYLLNIESLVSLDPLTGLNNRTQLRRYINQELRSNHDDTAYCLLMIDLNHFKSINDNFGHGEGDKAIIRTAEAIKRACSDNSYRPFISRYGGDEFVIIMKNADEKGIKEFKQRIRDELEKENIENRKGYQLSAAIGDSCFKGDYGDFRLAFEKADIACYNDKRLIEKAGQ